MSMILICLFNLTIYADSELLKRGDSSKDVEYLQQLLQDSGYFNYDTITGYYGKITEDAVKAFQKTNGLKIDGITGPATWAALLSQSKTQDNGQEKALTDDETINDPDVIDETNDNGEMAYSIGMEYGGLSGFVSGDYVKITSSSSETIGTIVDCSYLSVRTGSNTSYTRIGMVKRGTKHKLLGEKDGWYKISYDGKTGWISGKYVSVEDAGFSQLDKEGVTTATSLRVRAGAGLTYEQIGSLPLNSTVIIIGEENGFYKIEYNNKTGYISKAYVNLK